MFSSPHCNPCSHAWGSSQVPLPPCEHPATAGCGLGTADSARRGPGAAGDAGGAGSFSTTESAPRPPPRPPRLRAQPLQVPERLFSPFQSFHSTERKLKSVIRFFKDTYYTLTYGSWPAIPWHFMGSEGLLLSLTAITRCLMLCVNISPPPLLSNPSSHPEGKS